MRIEPSGEACGATVTGIDLAGPLWDNRAVLHRATGGYEGHRRERHRTTIAAPVYA